MWIDGGPDVCGFGASTVVSVVCVFVVGYIYNDLRVSLILGLGCDYLLGLCCFVFISL